jgi:hypothetical protein
MADGMTGWQNGRIAECRNGGMAEWQNGRISTLTAKFRHRVIQPTRRPHCRLSPPLRLRVTTIMTTLTMATTMKKDPVRKAQIISKIMQVMSLDCLE